MVATPTIQTDVLAMAVLAFLAGAACPVYYAQERLRGFGRAMLTRLPYEPPPGKEEAEAMRDATEQDDVAGP